MGCTYNKEDYCEGALLGSGTYGVVYAAVRKSDNLKVAIKHISNVSIN